MSQRKVAIIVHRWGGTPDSDWYPWLRKELTERDYDVVVPAMPDTDEPKVAAWTAMLGELLRAHASDDLLLIGHSVGCQTILRSLAANTVSAGKAVFVAGWVELRGLDQEETEIADPWLHEPFDVDAARSRMATSVALFSIDDPVVPVAPNVAFFRDQVGSEVVSLDGRGHFDEGSGIVMVPELLTYV